MPNSNLRIDVLACLKCFFSLQVVSLAHSYHQSRKNPTDFTTILAAVIILDQLDSDEDTSEQDHLLLMACHLLLSNTSHLASVRTSNKRRYMEDEATLAIMAFGLERAQKKRYLVPRHRRLSNRCKKQECFDAWFNASDRRWGVVVRRLSLLASVSSLLICFFNCGECLLGSDVKGHFHGPCTRDCSQSYFP
jgi:hypothetical protein